MGNRIFIVPNDGEPPVRWDPRSEGQPPGERDYGYFAAAVAEADRLLPDAGLRFILHHGLDRIYMTGRDVVVVLIGDERAQIPAVAGKVLAVFRTGSHLANPAYHELLRPNLTRVTAAARDLRDQILRFQRRPLTRGLDADVLARIFPIPLGYQVQVEVPVKPMAERRTDVFFAGGHEQPRLDSPRTWPLRPKNAARWAMARSIERLARARPDLRLRTIAVGPNQPGLDRRAFSEALADTKISLCPRGNFPETMRFFQSARAGAAIVGERVPGLWYYEGAPAVYVDDWSEAPRLIEQLLANPAELERLQAKALAWWRDVAGDRALGRFIAARLGEITKLDRAE